MVLLQSGRRDTFKASADAAVPVALTVTNSAGETKKRRDFTMADDQKYRISAKNIVVNEATKERNAAEARRLNLDSRAKKQRELKALEQTMVWSDVSQIASGV